MQVLKSLLVTSAITVAAQEDMTDESTHTLTTEIDMPAQAAPSFYTRDRLRSEASLEEQHHGASSDPVRVELSKE